MNFHNCHCKDVHTSRWCQYHPMVQMYSHNTTRLFSYAHRKHKMAVHTTLYLCVKMMMIMRKMNRMRTYYLRTSLSIQFHAVVNLLFMYDCETTGGSFYQDHIVEVGSMVIAPDGASISNDKFSSLCHTPRHIAHKGLFF